MKGKSPLRLACYLSHILEAIARIEAYVNEMKEAEFAENQLVQDAVIRNLEIIGEAANNISKRYPEFAAAHPELPLKDAFEMRNFLSHGYFAINLAVVWETVKTDLPALELQVRGVLEAFSSSSPRSLLS